MFVTAVSQIVPILTSEQLLMQMFATLNYIQTHHPYGEIPGQPNQAPQNGDTTDRKDSNAGLIANGNQVTMKSAENGTTPIKTEASSPRATSDQDGFKVAMRELAQDLVIQEQKAEILINSLPGIGDSERDQRQRMLKLQKELKVVEAERASAEIVKSEMLRNLDQVILSLKRGR